MVSIGRKSVSGEFSVDFRATGFGMFIFLEWVGLMRRKGRS